MAVYAITGKLGSGKSLIAVQRMETALLKGLRVATNIDLNLNAMLRPNNKTSRVIRVPDKPTMFDLECIGQGYEGPTYDEDKFGLLVLDELATWLNARNWNDKGRQELLNWFVHARKLRWHVYFLVQHEDVIDKQLRETLFEHVVSCRRLDRMKIPLVSWFTGLFGARVTFPKVHVGVVRYMLQQSAISVDTWYSYGQRCYDFYDTQQAFTPFYDEGVYSVLPPGYRKRSPATNWTPRKIMRYTKIVGKRYKHPFFVIAATLAGVWVGSHYLDSGYCNSWISDCEPEPAPIVEQAPQVQPEPVRESVPQPVEDETVEYVDPFHALAADAEFLQFQGVFRESDNKAIGFIVFHPSGKMLNLDDLNRLNWHITTQGGSLLLAKQGHYLTAFAVDVAEQAPQGSGRQQPTDDGFRIAPPEPSTRPAWGENAVYRQDHRAVRRSISTGTY